MPKYLIKAQYTAEGLRRLKEDGGTGRRERISNALSAVGGKLEAAHFALGEDAVIIIADVPDVTAVGAIGINVGAGATGAVRTRTVALMTPEEVDRAVKQNISYRPPGR